MALQYTNKVAPQDSFTPALSHDAMKVCIRIKSGLITYGREVGSHLRMEKKVRHFPAINFQPFQTITALATP